MTLPTGWTIDEEPKNNLPPGWKVEEEPSRPNAVRDVVGEELAAQGIEDENEFERAAGLGTAEATRGFISGVTLGISENIPGLKTGDNAAATAGKVVGSLMPLSRLIKVFSGPVMKLAAKSPVFQKQLGSLATMFGVGATAKGIETLGQGEIPSADDLLEHGVEWAALDAVLMSLGAGGRFAKGLLSKSQATGIPRKELLNQTLIELKQSGFDITKKDQAERATAKALEILERPIPETERKLSLPEKQPSNVETIAQERLNQLLEQPQIKLQAAPEEVIQKPSNKLAQKILNPEEITPKELKTKKINDEAVNRLTKENIVLSEPYQPEGINFTKEAAALEKNAIQDQIDTVGTRAATEEELGTAIREDIDAQLEARKAEYRPLYKQAETASEEIAHIPQNTAREAGNKLRSISRLSTKPAGYNTVIKSLEDVLADAGFSIERNKFGDIGEIISTKDVPVSDTIELARRLNEMVDYEAVEPTVKDALRSVARAAKQDIRVGLKSNPDALAAFELAEEAHANTAKKFTKDSIRGIRGQQAGEKISKLAESPSTLGNLKEVLSPEQYLQLEREMLEKLNAKTYEQGKKQLKELEKHLSAENKKLAREIVESKNPHNPDVKKKIIQDSILNDMSNAFTNGSRPSKTLDLWKTPKGQKLVKETFHNSPNWPQVKSYLEKQSFNDMVSSVLKDGKLDLKKFKSFMSDPATVNNIRSQGGEEAVTFFRNMNSQVKQLEGNVKLLDHFPKEKDISRGKDLIKRQKQRNIEEKELLLKEEEAANEAQKELNQKMGKLPEGKLGKEKIRRTKEKNLQENPVEKVAKENLSPREKTTGERGSKILKRMTDKDFPIRAKTKKWEQWFKETMGLNTQGFMTVFGLMKLGLPNTVVNLIGYRIFNRMLTSPRLRNAFSEAAKYKSDPVKFILAMEEIEQVMDEEEEK